MNFSLQHFPAYLIPQLLTHLNQRLPPPIHWDTDTTYALQDTGTQTSLGRIRQDTQHHWWTYSPLCIHQILVLFGTYNTYLLSLITYKIFSVSASGVKSFQWRTLPHPSCSTWNIFVCWSPNTGMPKTGTPWYIDSRVLSNPPCVMNNCNRGSPVVKIQFIRNHNLIYSYF